MAETAALFLKNKRSGAWVDDDRGRIIGLIGENDFFKPAALMAGRNVRG